MSNPLLLQFLFPPLPCCPRSVSDASGGPGTMNLMPRSSLIS